MAGVIALGLVVVSLVPPALVFGPSSGGTTTTALGPLGLVGRDKWLHAVGYAVLAGTLVPVFDADHARTRHAVARTALLAVAVATGVGLGVELLQWPHPGRTASLADATANLVGALVGAGTAVVVGRWRD